jgi:hypothetical protein
MRILDATKLDLNKRKVTALVVDGRLPRGWNGRVLIDGVEYHANLIYVDGPNVDRSHTFLSIHGLHDFEGKEITFL